MRLAVSRHRRGDGGVIDARLGFEGAPVLVPADPTDRVADLFRSRPWAAVA